MTKKQIAAYYRRMDAIHRRGMRRGFRNALETIRALQALEREYRTKDFASQQPAKVVRITKQLRPRKKR